MNEQILVEFMQSVPLWALSLMIMIWVFMIDLLYALWILRTTQGKAFAAANYGTLIYLFSVSAFTGILEVNNLLLIPAMIGGWLGSYLTIKWDFRKKHLISS